MQSEEIREVEAFADKILRKYFEESDIEYLVSTFAPDIIWVGGGEKMIAEGAEDAAAIFRAGKKDAIACKMCDGHYATRKLGEGAYVCQADSWLLPKEGSGLYFHTHQRCTFVFRREGGQLKAVHIHNSVPSDTLKEDELFPVQASRKAYQELEKALHQRAKFLSRLYETVPCGILQFATGDAHELVAVNPMVWRSYGFDSEEEYRKSVPDPFMLVEAEDQGQIHRLVDSLVLDGPPCIYTRRAHRRDGSEIWISVVMHRLVNADGMEVFQAVFNDITEIKKLQKAQEEAQLIENKSLRAAICTSYQLIMNINLSQDRYYCFVEEQDISAVGERSGSFSELIGKLLPGVHATYRQEYEKIFSCEYILGSFAAGNREIYSEFRQTGQDGLVHWVSAQLICVDNPVGEDAIAIMLVKTLDDIRAEKVRQEHLLRDALMAAKSANRAKSDFLSRMSHDIRTPMNAIIGMSTIGQLKLNDLVRVKDCFQKIDTSSRYLLSLINDILDMSKIESGKLELVREQFDLTEMLSDISAIIYPQSMDRKLHYEIHHTEPLDRYYKGDVLRIKQILMNLLSNALKFTPEEGRILFGIREQTRVNGYAYLEFTVSDTGIGMSEEFKKRIFQPFEQESAGLARNKVGSGLGLAIVYNLVQMMNGSITVDSRRGEGTVFHVSIPMELARVDEEREKRRKEKELLGGARVLVVDDDPVVGEQTAAILDEIGAHTTWTDSGRKAVELVAKGIEAGQYYNVAMIDWRMPDMDGVETTRRIRCLVGPETTIIIISAYDWSSIEQEAREAGATCFISKPLFRSNVYEAFVNLGVKRQMAPEIPELRAKAEAQAGQGESSRLLLVEDNDLNLEIAKSLLEMNGFTVDAVMNGRDAVSRYQEMPAGTYRAVLMDIRMPVMDGLEATRQIRGMEKPGSREVPIIAMSANAFEEDKVEAFKAGVSDYLVKPLDIQVLVRKLGELG